MAARMLCLWLYIVAVIAQSPKDPLKDFCRRYGHQTAVIDRKLYIDGGWVYAAPISQYPQATINDHLIYSDLNVLSDDMPQQFANLSKNSTVPSVAGGTLWADEVNKVFWQFGGQYQNAADDFELYGYDTILNQWNISTASSPVVQRVAYGAGTSMSDAGKAYYYGGYLNEHTTPRWSGAQVATNGLVVYDMDDNDIRNTSGPADGIPRAEGVMVSIPASAAGLLVYFGGVQFPSAAYGNYTEEAMDMSNIIVYDIGDAKWYTQTATGDVPRNRRKFCAGATWAKDQSSYQIYLYGGFGFGENATGYDDIYILSMPSFEWIKWYEGDAKTYAPHGDLTCNIIDGTQMIVMGGNFTYTDACDVPTIGAQHNLNLGQKDVTPADAKWFKFLPTLTDYQVPSAVISIAGGNGAGSASQTAPAAGFDDPALAVYFAGKATYAPRKPTRYIPPMNGSPSKSNIAAIAGGAAGGAVALLVVAFVSWCCIRRRRRARETGRKSPPAHHHGQPSEMPDNTTYQNYNTKGSYAGTPAASSHPSTPFTTPPPMMSPQYPQHHHPAHQPSPQSYFPVPQIHQERKSPGLQQQRFSPQYEMSASPRQEYFQAPDTVRRTPQSGPGMYEMPTTRTPGLSPTMHYPTPHRADTQTTSTLSGGQGYYDEKH